MAVISQISVGDIFYYQVDDIPTHVAPKGSIAIMDSSSIYDNGFTYINNDGNTTWLKCISPSFGGISLTNATNAVDFDALTLTSWYAFNASPTGAAWVLNSNSTSDWTLATENTGADDLKYTGSTQMRALVSMVCTIRGGASKSMQFQTGISRSFTVPPIFNSGWAADSATNGNTFSSGSQYILEVPTNTYFLGGLSPITRESGGGAATRSFIAKHARIGAVKIDEPLRYTATSINETFESNSFTANSWTVVNDTTNRWITGSNQNNTPSGTYSAYISDGTTNTYTINVSQASHFYKDFTFPSGATITLTFDWKCNGENSTAANQYDYGTVVITTTGTTPTAGSEITTAQATAGGDGRIGATTNLGKFNSAYGTTPATVWNTETIDLSAYAGQTKRLVFTWRNDNLVGNNPPMILDNIKITYAVLQY